MQFNSNEIPNQWGYFTEKLSLLEKDKHNFFITEIIKGSGRLGIRECGSTLYIGLGHIISSDGFSPSILKQSQHNLYQ